jgi:hypothetical protein
VARLIRTLVLLAAASFAHADVLVTSLDAGAPVRGISLTVTNDAATVHSAEGPVRKIPTGEVVEIVTVPPVPPAPVRPLTFQVTLTCGSRVCGLLSAGRTTEHLKITSPALGTKEVSIENVREIRRADGSRMPGSSRLVRIPDTDSAYTLTGARIEGTIAAFTAAEVSLIRGDSGARTIAYGDLAAVFVDTEVRGRPEGLSAVARLFDGSAVVLDRFAVQGGLLTGRTPSELSVSVEMNKVAAIGFQGESFLHLSDLKPAEVKRTPFFPLPEAPASGAMLEFVCPVRFDRSPDGNPITLHKHRYYKGIGVRPRTELTYALDGGFRHFRATCGIDDEVLGPGYGRGGGTGSVVFIVAVDGKQVFTSPPVEGGHEPVQVDVPVEGAKRLTLTVALVPDDKMPKGRTDSPELDNAVWARPLLIR